MSYPTTPQKNRLALMPPPPLPPTPTTSRPSQKVVLAPRPTKYVKAIVRPVYRVKSEMPSPPPSPVKNEPVEPATLSKNNAVTRYESRLTPRKTPSPRSRSASRVVSVSPSTRRRSSATPTVRSSVYRTPTPCPTFRRRVASSTPRAPDLTGTTEVVPIEVDYSPPPSPTPSGRYREDSSMSKASVASSTRSEEIFRGGSMFATMSDPFPMLRQRPIRRPRERNEEGSGNSGPPLAPVNPVVTVPQNIVSALIESKALVASLVEGDDAQRAERGVDIVRILSEVIFGKIGEAREKLVQEIVDAMAPEKVSKETVAEVVSTSDQGIKRAISAHIRRFQTSTTKNSRQRTSKTILLRSEWYKSWRTFLSVSGEDLRMSVPRDNVDEIVRALDEVIAMNARPQLERARAVIPAIERDHLRRWRDVVKKLSAEIWLEVMGRQ